MFQAKVVSSITHLWLRESKLCQLGNLADPVGHLHVHFTCSSKYFREPITAPRCFCPCIVILTAVSLNTSLTLASLSAFEIIQHFLALGKYPKSGPRVLRASHHFLIYYYCYYNVFYSLSLVALGAELGSAQLKRLGRIHIKGDSRCRTSVMK